MYVLLCTHLCTAVIERNKRPLTLNYESLYYNMKPRELYSQISYLTVVTFPKYRVHG